jgi:hypothetical protein
MKINRRQFVYLTGAALLQPAVSLAQPDPYDTLIQGQYANRIRFLQQAGGLYLGQDFKLTSTPTEWLLRIGEYKGKFHGEPVEFHGYWIYRTDANMCWQAQNDGGGGLAYWNQDGKATDLPGDREIFNLVAVDKQQRTVKISHKGRNYVGLIGDSFSCHESITNAAIFIVQFV